MPKPRTAPELVEQGVGRHAGSIISERALMTKRQQLRNADRYPIIR
ncbi:hypothetical protein [Thalassoglobus polymorphus]|nr:hypothetical protein [Thalassoglobus polymorphus]